MEDDINVLKMENNLNFLKMEDDINILKMENNLNFLKMEDDLHFFVNGRHPIFF